MFVVRGDLNKIHSDVVLIPTDDDLNVTRHWWGMFPAGSLVPSVAGWKRYVGPLGGGFAGGAARVAGGRSWLFIAGENEATPERLVRSTEAALAAVSSALGDEGRKVPLLVSLPLAGTGEGGLAGRRGEVIGQLLPALYQAASDLRLDIALVLGDDRDAAAVQAARRDGPGWKALPLELRRVADEVESEAAAGRLSLFIGAGVSKPLGLPDWAGLVAALWSQAGLGEMPTVNGSVDSSKALAEAAQAASDRLGAHAVAAWIRDHFTVDTCTLAHALLADLRVREAVTTNYDTAYEVAVAGLTRSDGGHAVAVLTRNAVAPDRPWLLKLHGDAQTGKGIVLTRDQYKEFRIRGRPQIGMVQSLLMTGHLLFVGYSLVDETFVELAKQVRAVLTEAENPRKLVGTVVPIARNDDIERRAGTDLRYLPMPVGHADADLGARLLQVFLDRVCWRAATERLDSMQYLLDDRYQGVSRTPGEEELRAVAFRLMGDIPPGAAGSRGWKHLCQALRHLGADLPERGGSEGCGGPDRPPLWIGEH